MPTVMKNTAHFLLHVPKKHHELLLRKFEIKLRKCVVMMNRPVEASTIRADAYVSIVSTGCVNEEAWKNKIEGVLKLVKEEMAFDVDVHLGPKIQVFCGTITGEDVVT